MLERAPCRWAGAMLVLQTPRAVESRGAVISEFSIYLGGHWGQPQLPGYQSRQIKRMQMNAVKQSSRGGLADPGRLNRAEAEVNGRCTGVKHPVGTDRAEASIWPIWAICALPLFFVNLN